MSNPKAPFQSLVREHRLLAGTLDALETYANRLGEDTSMGTEDLGRFVEFFKDFGELCHHVKEEEVLLPELARHGFDWNTGPLERTRKEHDQERYLVDVLWQAASQQAPWSREDRRHAVATLRAFIDFERRHIRLEDTLLLPAALERLSEAEVRQLDDRLEEFERDRFGIERYRTLSALAEDLQREYAQAA